MRSRLNLALVLVAGSLALVLTIVRRSPEGVVAIGLDTQEVRAAPGEALTQRHDLSALKIFNLTLLRIKERYVDPSRIDPKKMLYAALDSVQANIPEVLVEPDTAKNKVTVEVNDKREVFDTEDVDSPWRLAKKLRHIFQFVEINMNAGADLAKIEYAAVNGMLSTLDPHSILMDPDQARDMDVSTTGKFGGVGIVIRMNPDTKQLLVVKPMKDTPAWRAGIKAADHIVKIDNAETAYMSSQDAVDRMRGDPHTPVTLWIERKGHDGLLRFDITRDIIHVSQVDHKLLENHVGYIRVHQFSKGVASDVADAMREMQAQGANAWILDLRGNPGGLLEEAVQLADLFVDSGTVVTTVSGREREVRRAEPGGDTTSSLAVLVNGGSASASEIVTGALKNLDRAIIIGTRTFGKGSVQELYDNDDHSKLKLTIAQYLTPGDRSIQNLGIVPDILLHRMWVPDKLDGDDSFIRLLPPSHVYGEKDLDAHLVSTYAKGGDKPEYELPYLIEKPQADEDDEDDDTAGDDVVEDWEMRFADQLVSTVTASTRPKLVAGARQLVAKVAADEEKKLVAALGKLGIDWTPAAPPAAGAGAPNVDVQLAVTPAGTVHAGDEITLTATAKNTGAATAYRVLPRIDTDDSLFEDLELPIGELGPGETKTFSTKIKVPLDAYDRVDQLALEVREAPTAPVHTATTELHLEAAPHPVFAYAWQLVDKGNGDGLVQPGEHYELHVAVKNAGLGPTHSATVLLRNLTGDGVALDTTRLELKAPLAPGEVKNIVLPLTTEASLKADEVVLELVAYDSDLDVQTSDKLHFPVRAAVPGHAAQGTVTVKHPVAIRAGAADDASVVGEAPHGASYTEVGTFGTWTKVNLDQGGSHVGFVPTSDLASGGSGTGSFAAVWNATPPRISLAMKTLETTADTFKLEGTASDDQHVEDVYAFVSNENAKIDRRKVFYHSNRGGKNGKQVDFTADLPLWPGSNMITVVARSSSEVRTLKTLFVYRDPARTASTP